MPISLIFPRHCVYYINFAEMQRRFVFCVFIGISLRILLSHFIQVYLRGDEFQIVLVIYHKNSFSLAIVALLISKC